MFYKNKNDEYTIIEKINLSELQPSTLTIAPDTIAGRWYTYSFLKLYTKTRDNVYSEIFATYITLFMTEEDISQGNESIYFNQQIDTKIIHFFDESLTKSKNEIKQKRYFFQRLFNFFYSREAKGYEKIIFKYSIRMHKETKQKFFTGTLNYSEYLRKYMYQANIKRNENKTPTPIYFKSTEKIQINFSLSYTDSLLFESFTGESSREKLLLILEYIN